MSNKITHAGIQAVLLKSAIVGNGDMECKNKTKKNIRITKHFCK